MMLDRKRSYGKVTGHEKAHYEQDGKLYDAAGRELNDGLEHGNVPRQRDGENTLASSTLHARKRG